MSQPIEDQSKCGAMLSDFCRIPQRYIIGVICSIGAIIELATRSCIPFTLDRMVMEKNISITERRSHCPRGPGDTFHTHYHGHFDWSEEMQKLISLSFYIGHLLTHVPMGMVSERYGFKWPFLSTVLASAIVTGATPIVVETVEHWGLVCMNILLGATQGGMIPSLAVLLAHWYPQNERSRFGALLIGGGLIGNIFTQILSQCLLGSYHWSLIYYISAALGVIWCIIFLIFCYSTPQQHPCITDQELTYLNLNILNLTPMSELPPVPWKPMLTSLPVWAYIFMHIGHDWVLYGMLLDMPMYMSQVLRFSHVNVILWSSVPVIMLWISTIVWGFFSDYLLVRDLMNLNDLRKMNTLIAAFGPGLFLLFSSYARCHYVLAILFFTLCMVTTGPFFSGAKLNAVDLCPNYAGTLMGISNGLGSLGAIAPSVLNVVTTRSSLAEWRNVFWLDFSVICSAAVIYLLFGSSKIQKWNIPDMTERTL